MTCRWYDTLVRWSQPSWALPVCCSLLFQLWSEQEESLYWPPVVLKIGLRAVSTTVRKLRFTCLTDWKTQIFFDAGKAGKETSWSFALSEFLSCVSQLLPFPAAYWNSPRLKSQLKLKQRKSRNYLLTDALFLISFESYFTAMQRLISLRGYRSVFVILLKAAEVFRSCRSLHVSGVCVSFAETPAYYTHTLRNLYFFNSSLLHNKIHTLAIPTRVFAD